MPIKKLITSFFLLIAMVVSAQNKSGLVSGPWAGNVEIRNATIWLEVNPAVKSVAVKFDALNPDDKLSGRESGIINYTGELGKEFNIVKIDLNGLKMNTTYLYSVILNGKPITVPFSTKFSTKELWQWRKPAPDFTFLAGSCAYFNEPEFDRPGKPYGGDSSIFETMSKVPAAFNLWLGDNWYTREADYYTKWGLNYRPSHDRATPVLQKFMASMPQYSIWDDHDYGPNNSGLEYIHKEESRKVFMNYSLNPSYGEEGKGIYSVVSYSDVDLFLTDGRYFRSSEMIADSIDGKPNAEKKYFGKMQMEWLKNALLFSRGTFKIIATGSQILNQFSTAECLKSYSAEYYELLDFLAEHKIRGVLFFTGDRHFSEVIKLERPGLFPLYDITTSPFTAGVTKLRGAELTNPQRMPGTLVQEQNFARVSVSGKEKERVLTVEFTGIKGDKLGAWSVQETELKMPKK